MLVLERQAIIERSAVALDPLLAETEFYSAYDWCLDPHLTVGEVSERLAAELDRLGYVEPGWQAREVATNIYLLSSSLLNGVEEYLRGHTLRVPSQLAKGRLGRFALSTSDKVAQKWPQRHRTQLRRWKEEWQNGLEVLLAGLMRSEGEAAPFAEVTGKLSALLRRQLPSGLLDVRLGIPSAFNRLDLTPVDVFELGRRFMRGVADRSHPVLVLGLRTAGTYFSTLLCSFFKAEGYGRVAALTVHPKKGPSDWERRQLSEHARKGFTLVIVDDPPNSGGTIVLAVDIARQAGFDLSKIKVLVPTHPATPGWAAALPDGLVITLEPERWRKQQLLDPRMVAERLAEYLAPRGFSDVQVLDSWRAEELDGGVQHSASGKRGATLRRIFKVQLQTAQGDREVRHFVAKSVGLGYLGYPAFLVAQRLSEFVAPVLGLRDGILYSEWLPQQQAAMDIGLNRDSWIDRVACYVAARTRLLALPKSRVAGKAVHENGWTLLAEAFGRAYGDFVLDVPMRSLIQQQLYRLHCPCPTLIDGNMGGAEWIVGRTGLLKTGYFGHGLGKTLLNSVDPAYDLADAILSFELSPDEEERLVRRYVEHSGDASVADRLFINKLLAGVWAMETAQENLFSVVQCGKQQQEQHRRFLGAWDFLTAQTAQFCGARCRPSRALSWHSPLVFLDIDGVMDRRIFGYPSTTAAGIEALSLLSKHDCSVALNTARSVYEVKDYCEAYGLAGGVAENGAYLWDAVAGHGLPLIDQDTLVQLDELRRALRQLPGVFLDERHRYSIRAYMIEKKPQSLLSRMRRFSIGQGVPVPLPTLIVRDLIATLQLDRLCFRQTTSDTAVVAKNVNKGTGLTALRDRVLGPDVETIAIGDTEADLPMFRSATRSFAPAQIRCKQEARLLGCTISRYSYQRGLLDIVGALVDRKADGSAGRIEPAGQSDGEHLFLDLLRVADRLQARALVGALFNRAAFRIFIR
ncbi:HAD hydrolase family protein [Bradyrhizobium sp. C9]|uniref:HAD hydrolase family protein n=1 Tax=Bradyrhizobium sp. C9 TaxID=142585 RepID=UPI001304581D|nr:HAD hydrolase family protein [Bradyrhizobium sp. C9]